MSLPSFETSDAEPAYRNFNSWGDAWAYLAKDYADKHADGGRFNPDVIAPATSLPYPSRMAKFGEASSLSFDLNADGVYRDNRERCSLQVRVYEPQTDVPDRVTRKRYDSKVYYIQFNYHNPTSSPREAIRHLVDVFKIETPFTKGPEDQDDACKNHQDTDC